MFDQVCQLVTMYSPVILMVIGYVVEFVGLRNKIVNSNTATNRKLDEVIKQNKELQQENIELKRACKKLIIELTRINQPEKED